MDNDLFYPVLRVTIGPYTFHQGIELECCSSTASYFDWAKLKLVSPYQSVLSIDRLTPAQIELGYSGVYESVFKGYVVSPYQGGEILLKDDMIRLEETIITKTFLDVIPQDIILYALSKAGIEASMLSAVFYPRRKTVPVVQKSVISLLEAVHAIWQIKPAFHFSGGMFYWGVEPPQNKQYTFRYAENIISLRKQGTLWELETVSAPFIKHSHWITVSHPQISGNFKATKVIHSTEATGFIRSRITFQG